ncbi:MAG: hypothetical protein M1818_007949 [Claussenomyces sp. TS43310]|nr:MAG: hypothetical protein M1818_007949 [Claussenomyces sp. TS43310]
MYRSLHTRPPPPGPNFCTTSGISFRWTAEAGYDFGTSPLRPAQQQHDPRTPPPRPAQQQHHHIMPTPRAVQLNRQMTESPVDTEDSIRSNHEWLLRLTEFTYLQALDEPDRQQDQLSRLIQQLREQSDQQENQQSSQQSSPNPEEGIARPPMDSPTPLIVRMIVRDSDAPIRNVDFDNLIAYRVFETKDGAQATRTQRTYCTSRDGYMYIFECRMPNIPTIESNNVEYVEAGRRGTEMAQRMLPMPSSRDMHRLKADDRYNKSWHSQNARDWRQVWFERTGQPVPRPPETKRAPWRFAERCEGREAS